MRRPLLFLCVCLFVLIALMMHIYSPPPWEGKPGLRGKTVVVSGQVYDKEYREYENEKVLILFLKSVSTSSSDFNSKEKIRCEIKMETLPYLEDGSVYLPCMGNRVTLRGRWQEFTQATNPGEFDLARYYGVEGIVGGLSDAQVLGSTRTCRWLREILFRCKQQWIQNLYKVFKTKEASILAKMLLGEGSGLDAEIRELYQSAGIAHVLSISGLHISMLGMGLYHLLRRCRIGVRVAASGGAVVIVLYGLTTGFGVSACRAIGMYLVHMLGEICGKTYDMLTAMGVLCAVMLIGNPRLVYHSGYLLSFSSVCGVGLLAPVLQGKVLFLIPRPYEKRKVRWLKKRAEQLWKGFTLSLSVTLFTLPIQMFFFYKVPVYSVFLNLFVIPFVSIVMVLGFLIMLMPVLGFLGPVETSFLVWFEWLCRMFQKIPGHTWLTGKPDMWKILVYYAILLCLILGRKGIRKRYYYPGIVILVLFVGVKWNRTAQITFLDVGQGDCAVVETEDGKCFLFDCGSSNQSDVGEKILIPFLQHQGIREIDGVFLSHPDADHTNGVLQLLEGGDIKVDKVFLPDYAGAKEGFGILYEYMPGERIVYVSAGMCMEGENVRLICLHPVKGYHGSDDNEASACFLLEMRDVDILFTGDISQEREEALLEEWRRQGQTSVDVLKVAHHGSRFSTSTEFLEAVKPEVAVISCGRNNLYGHPHPETLERLEEVGSMVVITPQYGAVTIEVTGDERLWVSYAER